MAYAAMPQRSGLGRQLLPVHAVAGGLLAAAYAVGGPHALAVAAMLGLLEVMLSADGVLLNAALLSGLGRFWQRLFLTVGLLVTSVAVRFAVPLAVVCASARISPPAAFRLLSADPQRYRLLLAAVQPYIGAFVGIFLLTVFLEFVFGYHDVLRARGFGPRLRWRIGAMTGFMGALRRLLLKIPLAAELIALAVAIVAAVTVPPDLAYKVLGAAVAGLATRYAVRRIIWRLHFAAEGRHRNPPTSAPRRSGSPMTGRSALGLVCYVELFNAVTSLDSALTAFSLTLNAALICLGLLIGASYARSISVYLARSSRGDALHGVRSSPYGKAEGALAYLGYGRYQSVGLISVLMLVTVWRDIPGGLVRAAGIAVILLAAASSGGARLVEARKLRKERMRIDEWAARRREEQRRSEEALLRRLRAREDGQSRRADGHGVGLVALHIYLSDGREHAEVERAVEAWLAAAGLEVVFRDDPVLGSWSRTLWVRLRATARGQAAGEVAATVVRTIELRHYSVLDAQVTATLMQSTAQVLTAMQNSKDAALRLGAVLIVKVDWVPVVTQLSAAQQLKLDHHPEMLDFPAQLLRLLGMDETGTPASGEQPQALGE